jgi:hypothetical protein
MRTPTLALHLSPAEVEQRNPQKGEDKVEGYRLILLSRSLSFFFPFCCLTQ